MTTSKTTNQAMNDFIRGIRRQPAQVAAADPAPPIPRGNAGNGTGAPPPAAPPRSMNDLLRSAHLGRIVNRTFWVKG